MISPLFSSPVGIDAARSHLYDVIVVGAGPAGSSAAYHLARRGVDVLLVDRFAFPRDKRCGDAVMSPAIAELALMGLAGEMSKRFLMMERIGVWQKNLPGGYHPADGGRGYVAPRVEFDALLCEHALRHGAAWLDRVTVYEALPGGDHLDLQASHEEKPVQLRARLVIAANGSGSRLARSMRFNMGRQAGLASESLTAPQDDRARFTAMRGYYPGYRRPERRAGVLLPG